MFLIGAVFSQEKVEGSSTQEAMLEKVSGMLLCNFARAVVTVSAARITARERRRTMSIEGSSTTLLPEAFMSSHNEAFKLSLLLLHMARYNQSPTMSATSNEG